VSKILNYRTYNKKSDKHTKILHVCGTDYFVKHIIASEIRYFVSLGCQIDIASPDHTQTKWLRDRGFRMHTIDLNRNLSIKLIVKSVKQLYDLMKSEQYHLVQAHTPVAAAVARLAAKLAGVPNIVYVVHGFYFHDNMHPIKYQLFYLIERILSIVTDIMLFENSEDLRLFKNKLFSKNKTRYLGGGIDMGCFNGKKFTDEEKRRIQQEIDIPKGSGPIIGTIARLTGEKGLHELVDAVSILKKKHQNIHLLIIGLVLNYIEEEYIPILNQLITDKSLENNCTIVFGNDVPKYLSALDIFTLPSYREGLPRSIMEAMAMRLPVVGTDIRGIREQVVDGETGLLVPVKNSVKLAEAVDILICDPEKRNKFGNSGRARAERFFDEKLIFSRIELLYREVGVL